MCVRFGTGNPGCFPVKPSCPRPRCGRTRGTCCPRRRCRRVTHDAGTGRIGWRQGFRFWVHRSSIRFCTGACSAWVVGHCAKLRRRAQSIGAIWILDQSLRPDDSAYARRYRVRDDRGYDLIDHGSIWVLELNKFAAAQVETERERWLKFFKEAERFDEATLPDWMHTAEMRQAMSTLNAFSEKERAYHAYQARQEFLRQQRGIQRELDEARAAKEANGGQGSRPRRGRTPQGSAKTKRRLMPNLQGTCFRMARLALSQSVNCSFHCVTADSRCARMS